MRSSFLHGAIIAIFLEYGIKGLSQIKHFYNWKPFHIFPLSGVMLMAMNTICFTNFVTLRMKAWRNLVPNCWNYREYVHICQLAWLGFINFLSWLCRCASARLASWRILQNAYGEATTSDNGSKVRLEQAPALDGIRLPPRALVKSPPGTWLDIRFYDDTNALIWWISISTAMNVTGFAESPDGHGSLFFLCSSPRAIFELAGPDVFGLCTWSLSLLRLCLIMSEMKHNKM